MPALIVSIFHATIVNPLLDLFHEGEYLAPHMLVESGTPPLLIHGLMDYLPVELAAALFGNDHLIAGCRFINLVLVFVATVAFIGAVFEITKGASFRPVAALFGLLFVADYNGSQLTALLMQQGSPGLRDLFLLLELWLVMLSLNGTHAAKYAFSFSAGFASAIGLYWCYNRGVIGIAMLVVVGIASRIRRESSRVSLFPAAGCAVGLVFYALVNDQWMSELHNIVYWVENESIWNYEEPLISAFERLVAIVVPSIAIVVCLLITILNRRQIKSKDMTIAITLVLISTAVLQQQVHRNDFNHQMFIRPYLYLLIVQTFMFDLSWYPSLKRSVMVEWSAFGLIAMVSVLECMRPVSTAAVLRSHLSETFTAAFTGLPADADLLPTQTRKIVTALQNGSPRCTYVLNNGGALYAASRVKPCSSVFLPIYASKDAQYRVIRDLQENHPNLIVGFSKDWWSSMDGKPLAERTPELSSWISSHYGRHFSIGSTELRTPSLR